METLFLYFGKVILACGVMFLYYKLFLKDKTFHHYNRFYLLGILVVSVALPFLKVSYFTIEVNSNIYVLLNKLQNFNSVKSISHDFNYFQTAAVVLGLGSIFFLSKLILGILKIQQLKEKFAKENIDGINFYRTNLPEAPFSFFRNLFWKDNIHLQSDLGRQILKHEMVHIEQNHSIDRIIIEILSAVFWFNPVFYLIKKEISLIHEYLADKKAVKNSDTKAFAQMLLASHFSGKEFQATSPFLSSNLKRRLTMLQKSKTKYGYARKILALPMLFAIAFIYLISAKNKEITETNLEIANYVSKMATDTIPPPPPPPATANEEPKALQLIQKEIDSQLNELEPDNNIVRKSNEEASKLTTEMQLKSKEIEKLVKRKNFDSPDLKNLEKEMDLLNEKLTKIYDGEDFKNSIKKIETNHAKMDELYAKIDQYYNSEEFKSRIKNADDMAKLAESRVNSPEFKKRIKIAEERAKAAEKRVNSPEFKQRIIDAEKRAKEMEKKFNSPEFKARIQEAEKRAKEIEKKYNSPEFRSQIITTQNGNGSTVIVNSNDKKIEVKGDDVIYYIDGKISSKAEMDKIKPNNIEKIEVFKNNKDGKSSGQVHITTKK